VLNCVDDTEPVCVRGIEKDVPWNPIECSLDAYLAQL
jgi:hypothetical protein